MVRLRGAARAAREGRAMSDGERDDVTALLAAACRGEEAAEKQLAQAVYAKLHRRAAMLMRSERGDHTLQPTVLVHDAYLKLVRQERATYRDRGHFFATAAQTMRRLLVDHARTRR